MKYFYKLIIAYCGNIVFIILPISQYIKYNYIAIRVALFYNL